MAPRTHVRRSALFDVRERMPTKKKVNRPFTLSLPSRMSEKKSPPFVCSRKPPEHRFLVRRHEENLRDIIELVIDEGRRPYATFQGNADGTEKHMV